MAELDVQRRKKSSVLPWVLLALGVIALIYFLTRNRDEERQEQPMKNSTTYQQFLDQQVAQTKHSTQFIY